MGLLASHAASYPAVCYLSRGRSQDFWSTVLNLLENLHHGHACSVLGVGTSASLRPKEASAWLVLRIRVKYLLLAALYVIQS